MCGVSIMRLDTHGVQNEGEWTMRIKQVPQDVTQHESLAGLLCWAGSAHVLFPRKIFIVYIRGC